MVTAAKIKQAAKEWQKEDQKNAMNLRILMAGLDVTKEAMASKLGMSRRTLGTRLKHPESMTLMELRLIKLYAQENGILLS